MAFKLLVFFTLAQTAFTCMVKLMCSRPHLSQPVVESLLTQLHNAQDIARIPMCHCLAAIAVQLPVLGEGMLGELMELYKMIGSSSTDKQQELMVKILRIIFCGCFICKEQYLVW